MPQHPCRLDHLLPSSTYDKKVELATGSKDWPVSCIHARWLVSSSSCFPFLTMLIQTALSVIFTSIMRVIVIALASDMTDFNRKSSCYAMHLVRRQRHLISISTSRFLDRRFQLDRRRIQHGDHLRLHPGPQSAFYLPPLQIHGHHYGHKQIPHPGDEHQ